MKNILALCALLLFTGCASTGPTTQNLSALVEVAAYTGSLVHIQDNPGDRPAFVVAYAAVEKLINSKNYSPTALAEALSGLHVREFKGSRGTLIVTSAVLLWDTYAPNIETIDSERKVLPVLEALQRGIGKALADTQ